MDSARSTESALIVALTPYIRTFSLFAVSMPPSIILHTIPTNRRGLLFIIRTLFALYVIIHLLVSFWIIYVYIMLIGTFLLENSLDLITCVFSVGIIIAQLLVQIAVYTQAVTGHYALRNILITGVQLEKDIRKQFTIGCSLSSIRWRLGVRAGLWLLICSTFVPYLSYRLTPQKLYPLKRGIIVFFSCLIQIKGVEYCVGVQLVQELLLLVQQQLIHLRHKLLRCERSEARCILYIELQANQQLLARIWNLLNQVERYFCTPMLMLFFYNGFAIIQAIHWAYINFLLDDLDLRLCRIVHTVMLIVALLLPCYLSQCCIDEYNRFGTMLHKLKTVGIDENLSMRLQEYSLQLMHQRMLFTCGGFFDINLKNFGAISLTITTYIVILIQFKLQAETENKSALGARFE